MLQLRDVENCSLHVRCVYTYIRIHMCMCIYIYVYIYVFMCLVLRITLCAYVVYDTSRNTKQLKACRAKSDGDNDRGNATGCRNSRVYFVSLNLPMCLLRCAVTSNRS